MTLAVVAAYLALVLAVGLAGRRLLAGTREDYFLATRTIGPVLLLLSLFGTHMTAFSLLGASGEAYSRGVGVFSLMASSSALVVPVVFLLVGTRTWVQGKRHGFLTQVEFFRERWGSEAVGYGLFPVLVVLVVPYLLIGVMGGGITLAQITEGRVAEWVGSALVAAVVLVYVTAGGLRSTAWANAFQTVVFMVLGAVTFVVVVRELGGLGGVLSELGRERPELLFHGERIRPWTLVTYAAIPLSVGMFPHIFMHWLTARSAATFRLPVVAYPLAIAVVWVPSVLLGVMGAVAVPGLEGPAANSVLVRMIEGYAPEVLAGLLAAGVLAAVMSSLDSQVLALSTLFTRDVVGRAFARAGRPLPEGREVLVGRLFVVALLAATFALSLVVDRSIFRLGVWSFTGFASLLPLAVAALYWRRSTRQGALACLATAALLWGFFFLRGWEEPGYTVGDTGVMPVAVILAASTLALVVGSLLSPAPDPARVARFFPEAVGGGADAASAVPRRAPTAAAAAGTDPAAGAASSRGGREAA